MLCMYGIVWEGWSRVLFTCVVGGVWFGVVWLVFFSGWIALSNQQMDGWMDAHSDDGWMDGMGWDGYRTP